MKVAPHSNVVRQIVMRTFAELSAKPVVPAKLDEMIVIDDGKYRGRSYRANRLMAMWLVDVGLVQVYAEDGAMLRTINLFEEQVATPKAA